MKTPFDPIARAFSRPLRADRHSLFVQALRRYGLQNCCAIAGAFLIGLPPRPGLRARVRAAPAVATRYGFLAGPEQTELISAFLQSEEAQRVTCMKIGTSHHYQRQNKGNYDLSNVVSLFKGRELAHLQSLSIGDMFVLYNEDVRYCRLGDITATFAAAPALRILDLCGSFTLAQPVQHAMLEEFSAEIDDPCGSAGVISQDSLDNLLASRMPKLRSLTVVMEEHPDHRYRLPDLAGMEARMPLLQTVLINNLEPTSAARLRQLQARLAERAGPPPRPE